MERRARGVTASLRAGTLIALLALAATGCSGSANPAPSATPPASAPSATGAPASSASPASTASASGAVPDWPMYHGDPAHSGLSSSMPDVIGMPKVIESIKLDGAVYTSPIAVGGGGA